MKKLIIALLAIASLCALTGCDPETQHKTKYQDGTKMYSRRFVLDGHTYIEFVRPGMAYDNLTGFEHDPECLKKDIKKLLDEHMKEQGK